MKGQISTILKKIDDKKILRKSFNPIIVIKKMSSPQSLTDVMTILLNFIEYLSHI